MKHPLKMSELTKHEEESVGAWEDEWVPTFVLVVDHGIDAVAGGQGEEHHSQISGTIKLKKLLGITFQNWYTQNILFYLRRDQHT